MLQECSAGDVAGVGWVGRAHFLGNYYHVTGQKYFPLLKYNISWLVNWKHFHINLYATNKLQYTQKTINHWMEMYN